MPLRLILSDSQARRDYVLAVIGPLDLPTSRELRGWLNNPAPGYGVVLDLSCASPVSANCIEVVADAHRTLTALGHAMRVIAPDQLTADVIRTVGVQDVVIDRRDESRLAPDAADSAAPAQLPVAQQAGSAGGV